MRVLIVLNENPLGSHPDVYEAFENLMAEGLISGYDVIPFPHLRAQGVPDPGIVETIRGAVLAGGHGLVIWMHTGSLVVPDDVLNAIKESPGRPKMAYWEGDSYHPWYKPLPRPMAAIMRRCDAVFMPCGGPVLKTLRAAGVQRVLYAPSCASGTRFPHVWRADEPHEHDIVVVGNRVSSRVPFKTMPGARHRAALVRALVKRYGRRVAVYGTGWTGPSAMGPIAFDEQSAVYRKSRVTVGVNNSTYPYVFSNRLPITMATGVPLLYRRNPGFDVVFPEDLQDSFFSSPGDLYDGVDRILAEDAGTLEARSRAGREFFERGLERYAVARLVVRETLYVRSGRSSRGSAPTWMHLCQLLGEAHR
ncbi:MAG: glycosyltransferase [Coriobacteriia bacterium]|nr:glycosyltransferase [Coriobacteriia bacterium]